jgi:hypothetical protein
VWWNLAIHVVAETLGNRQTREAMVNAAAPFGDYYTSLWAKIGWQDGSTWQWALADIGRGLQLTIPPAKGVSVGIVGGDPFAIVGQGEPPDDAGYFNTLLSGSISPIHNPANRTYTVTGKHLLEVAPGTYELTAPPHAWRVEAHKGQGNLGDLQWTARGGAIVGPMLAWIPGQFRTGLATIPSYTPCLQAVWMGDDLFVETVWECKL